MMKKLILFGASNFADEIVQMFRDINKSKPSPEWEICGLLDDSPLMQGKIRNGIPVLGPKTWMQENDLGLYYFVCCIGNPKAKAKVVAFMKSCGAKFASGIHPSVILSETTVVGEGTVITAGNILTTNIQVGNHIIINLACTIGHYTILGDYCTINPGSNISGDVILGEGVYLGTNCTILEKMRVGEYSVIGAGAMVNKHIPANVTAVGIPAKVIK
jgi:sugar O-acyltransferase (sialic acid O-acetyltransferase NeuD family)